MISEGEKEEIRTLVKLGRKRSLNFAVCMGEEPVETVFVMHRRTISKVLARQARADGTTAKIAKGRMEVDGRTIKLCCEGIKPTGLAKNLKKYLKLLKLNMSVELVDEVAELPSDEEENVTANTATPEEDHVAEAGQSESLPSENVEEPSVSPERARYDALAAPLRSQMEQLGAADDPRSKKIAAIWGLAEQRAEDGDLATAIKALTSLAARL